MHQGETGGLLSFSSTLVKIQDSIFAGTTAPIVGFGRNIIRVEHGELSLEDNCFVGNAAALTPVLTIGASSSASDTFWQQTYPDEVVPFTNCPFLARGDVPNGPFSCFMPTSLVTCTAASLTNVTSPLLPCESTLSDIQRKEAALVNDNVVRTYILCPNTDYLLGSPLVLTRPNVRILCGADGQSGNQCIVTGGDVQMKVVGGAVDINAFVKPLTNLLVHGLTFTQGEGVNVLVQHPCDLTLEQCIFMVRTIAACKLLLSSYPLHFFEK